MAPPSVAGSKPTMQVLQSREINLTQLTSLSDMVDEVVKIVVGADTSVKHFLVHKKLLSHYSGYFDRALNGNFNEAETKEIVLPEEKTETFEHFILWIYTGALFEDNEVFESEAICKSWLLADRRDVPLLMNATIDLLREKIVHFCKIPTQQLNLIYSNTTEGTGLRRFLIRIISCNSASSILAGNQKRNWPQEACWDLLKQVWEPQNADKTRKQAAPEMDMCEFHCHEAGVRCPEKESTTSPTKT